MLKVLSIGLILCLLITTGCTSMQEQHSPQEQHAPQSGMQSEMHAPECPPVIAGSVEHLQEGDPIQVVSHGIRCDALQNGSCLCRVVVNVTNAGTEPHAVFYRVDWYKADGDKVDSEYRHNLKLISDLYWEFEGDPFIVDDPIPGFRSSYKIVVY